MYVDIFYAKVKQEKFESKCLLFQIRGLQHCSRLEQIVKCGDVTCRWCRMVQSKSSIFGKKACIRQSACSVCTWKPFVSSHSSKNMSKCS